MRGGGSWRVRFHYPGGEWLDPSFVQAQRSNSYKTIERCVFPVNKKVVFGGARMKKTGCFVK